MSYNSQLLGGLFSSSDLWNKLSYPVLLSFQFDMGKDVHILVPFADLSSLYSKFKWAENAGVQACTKKLSSKQICCATKWFL